MSMSCNECWNEYSKSELVNIDNKWICGQCKETYLQRLQEGVQSPQKLEYAGFWIRVCAKLIDTIIFAGISAAVILIFGVVTGISFRNPENPTIFSTIRTTLNLLISWGLPIFLLGRYGATPGKMLLGLKVIKSDGERVTYLRAFCRFLSEMISFLILCIGFIMVAFREDKTGLHDIICDTRVIKK